jgi:hypothetical protein
MLVLYSCSSADAFILQYVCYLVSHFPVDIARKSLSFGSSTRFPHAQITTQQQYSPTCVLSEALSTGQTGVLLNSWRLLNAGESPINQSDVGRQDLILLFSPSVLDSFFHLYLHNSNQFTFTLRSQLIECRRRGHDFPWLPLRAAMTSHGRPVNSSKPHIGTTVCCSNLLILHSLSGKLNLRKHAYRR